MNQSDQENLANRKAEQIEVYRNISEICKEHFNKSLAHLDALHSKANFYLSYLTLLTVLWGVLIKYSLENLSEQQSFSFWTTLIFILLFITFINFVITLGFIIRVMKLTDIEGYPKAAEIVDKLKDRQLLDYYASISEHFKKIATNNSVAVKGVEDRLHSAYIFLAVSLLFLAASAGTTVIYQYFQVKPTQEDSIMGDENTKQTNNNSGNSNSGNTQTEQPALEKPVIIPLNAEPLRRGVGLDEIPKIFPLTPEVLKYSEDNSPKTTEEKE
ncbi:hypothetical protein K8T06_12645 [bacterium]|nr:hypothetical protein [bacterium]